MTKIIAVVGATGEQGSGLVHSILAKPGDFRVRALTRDLNSEKSKQLQKAGAEVVVADVDDQASLETAFAGAHGVFAVTFFWHHFSGAKETQQAKNIAQAAKNANVKHVVWSTLEDTRPFYGPNATHVQKIEGDMYVPHLDAKGAADVEFKKLSVPTTFLLTSFYWDNFWNFGMAPQRGEDGKLTLYLSCLGELPLAGIAGPDIGKAAHALFVGGPEKYGWKTVGVASDHLTVKQIASAMEEVVGEPVAAASPPLEFARAFPFPHAAEIAQMFAFKHDFNAYFCGVRNVQQTKELVPDLSNLKAYLHQNKDKLLAKIPPKK